MRHYIKSLKLIFVVTLKKLKKTKEEKKEKEAEFIRVCQGRFGGLKGSLWG